MTSSQIRRLVGCGARRSREVESALEVNPLHLSDVLGVSTLSACCETEPPGRSSREAGIGSRALGLRVAGGEVSKARITARCGGEVERSGSMRRWAAIGVVEYICIPPAASPPLHLRIPLESYTYAAEEDLGLDSRSSISLFCLYANEATNGSRFRRSRNGMSARFHGPESPSCDLSDLYKLL